MKATTAILTPLLALAVALAAPGTAAPNQEQTGENGDCLDWNLFYLLEGVDSPSAVTVTVDAGTGFTASSESGPVYVDFRDAEGNVAGYNDQGSGTAPAEAAYAIICVGVGAGYPEVPIPSAPWSYQDGL